jgi:hypothetical protein
MGDGSAELVTDLPVGAFAFVLEFCVRPKRKAQSLIEAAGPLIFALMTGDRCDERSGTVSAACP